MPRHTFQQRSWNKRNACSCDHTGQHPVIRLHLVNSSRSGTVSMKPALEVATIRTMGAEGINVTAVNLTGADYWRMTLWRDDHQLLAVYRYPVNGSMVNGPINKCRIQLSLQHSFQHSAGRAGGK